MTTATWSETFSPLDDVCNACRLLNEVQNLDGSFSEEVGREEALELSDRERHNYRDSDCFYANYTQYRDSRNLDYEWEEERRVVTLDIDE